MSKIEPLTPILSSYTGINKLNGHLDKIEAALNNTLSRDGSSPNEMEANIDMNANQLINLAAPVLPHNATTKAYVDGLAFGTSASTVIENSSIVPQAYGATAGLGSDQTAFMQLAINAAFAAKKPLDLVGQTWRVDSGLTIPGGMTIRNGTLNFANAPNNAWCLESFGSLGTQYTLTAAPTKGSTSVAVSAATGLVAGDWLIIKSTDDFSPLDSGKKGEWVQVLSVSGLTINLCQRVRHTYTTGHTLYKPVLKTDVTIDNVNFIGSGITGAKAQYAIRAYLNKNITIKNCTAEDFGYTCYSLESCLNGGVTDCQGTRGNFSLGSAYGVALTGGCHAVTVSGGHYSYFRHGVSIGGTFFTEFGHTITGVVCSANSDAGIDVHPNSMSIVISGNMIDCYSTDTTQQGDGITAQGAGIIIANNIVRGWRRSGILCQPLTNAPELDDTWTITGNNLSNNQGTTTCDGIVFSSEKGTGETIRSVVISGNTINSTGSTTGKGIMLYNTTSGGPIRTVVIANNAIYCRDEAIEITAKNLELIEDVVISGNSMAIISAVVPVIELNSNVEASKFLSCVNVVGNIIRGGTYGISLINSPARIIEKSNLIQGFATAATLGTFASSSDSYTV